MLALFGIEDWIHDFLLQIVCWIRTAAVETINAVVSALAALVASLLGVLPDVPAFPTVPSWITSAASWVAWVFPVHQAVLAFGFVLTAWVIWQGVALVLRWVKLV